MAQPRRRRKKGSSAQPNSCRDAARQARVVLPRVEGRPHTVSGRWSGVQDGGGSPAGFGSTSCSSSGRGGDEKGAGGRRGQGGRGSPAGSSSSSTRLHIQGDHYDSGLQGLAQIAQPPRQYLVPGFDRLSNTNGKSGVSVGTYTKRT